MEDGNLLWVGRDERDRELEIIAVPTDDDTIVVKHIMPTALRTRPKW